MTTQATSATAQTGAEGSAAAALTGAAPAKADAQKPADAPPAAPAKAEAAQPTKTDDAKTDKPADPAKATEGTEAELTFTFPEGVAPDETILAAVKPVMKELGLKSEGAQKLVSAYVTAQGESVSRHLAKQNEEWIAQAKADKEIGGAKFEKAVAAGQRALKQFGDADLTKLLEESGFGNHPAFLRVWNRIAQAMGNDSVAGTTAAGAAGAKSPDEALIEGMFTHPSSQKYNKE